MPRVVMFPVWLRRCPNVRVRNVVHEESEKTNKSS